MRHVSMFKPYVNKAAIKRVLKTLKSGWIGEGTQVQEFEAHLKKITRSNYTIAVNSGTSALHIALIIAGVQTGDEVITTAQTMLATTQAILVVGAKPVYADIQFKTGNIDPDDIVKRISRKTKAILPVDWAGYPCDYKKILGIAKKYNLILVEDAAHALGAVYRGKPVGSICPITCFSFQAIKHLTTGDGGMVCVKKKRQYEKAVRLRWFGIDRFKRKPSLLGEPEWNVTELGYKYHMNDIAAAVGLGNLLDFDSLLKRRHQIVSEYRNGFKKVAGLTLFDRAIDRQSADWLFSIHIERREDFCRMMKAKGIEVSVVHLRIDKNDICGGLRDDLPVLRRFTESHVSLPLHNQLKDADVKYVIKSIEKGW